MASGLKLGEVELGKDYELGSHALYRHSTLPDPPFEERRKRSSWRVTALGIETIPVRVRDQTGYGYSDGSRYRTRNERRVKVRRWFDGAEGFVRPQDLIAKWENVEEYEQRLGQAETVASQLEDRLGNRIARTHVHKNIADEWVTTVTLSLSLEQAEGLVERLHGVREESHG